MPLNVGSRLGHYDFTAHIGEGGMGRGRLTLFFVPLPPLHPSLDLSVHWLSDPSRRWNCSISCCGNDSS